LVHDPIEFQETILGRTLWSKQKEICRAVIQSPKRITSIKGCHGSGKTYTVAGLVPYSVMSDPESIVLTVAPTLRQVKLMWNEIETAIVSMKFRGIPERSTTGWRLSENNYALGFSSSKGVNAQGFHAKRILILADEAIGISPDLWDAIEGIRAAGDVRLVRLCNPTVPAGAPFDDFTKSRAVTECITISAFDTPNLEGLTIETLLLLSDEELDYAPFPWLTRRRWVKEMYYKWGPLNPRFQSRVLGEFPTQADNAVFDLKWIERAKREPTELELERAKTPGTFIQVGIDVAGPGDDETAGCARVNGIVIARAAWMDADPRGKVVIWLSNLARLHGFPLGPVVVDVVGIGYNFALHLADQGFQVYGFNPSRQPLEPERFLNGKAEQYFRLRDIYQDNYICHLPEAWDEDEAAQLSAIQYRETSRGLIQVEPKDEARARGVQSPDRAEAKVMAFARIVPAEQLLVYGKPQTISAI
jgi:hypothetical protein